MVTVLLLNYKREANLPKIISSLRAQTIPCEIFLWNNSGTTYKNDQVDWIVNSGKNVRCWPRWTMAPFASGEYVMTLDDDICFTSPDCLELLVSEMQENYIEGRALGVHGVITDDKGNYYLKGFSKRLRKMGIIHYPKHFEHPEENMLVDIIKGRMIFFKKKDLKRIPIYPNESEHFSSCDDIIVSSYLCNKQKRHHMLTSKLNGKVEELSGGKEEMALSSAKQWVDLRNEVSKLYFNKSH